MGATILVVDDEKNIRRTLRMVLEGPGHQVTDVGDARSALQQVENQDFDLVIADVRMPEMSGNELLEELRRRPDTEATPIIMISGHASLEEAVHSVKLGATDFLEKPLDRDRVLISVNNALESARLGRELRRLRAQADDRYAMLGKTPTMKALFTDIEKVAPTRGRVLITGESGTGKELIARAIHSLSDRRDRPFVMLNCAAIPADLIESELFGHERGAFTGATGRKRGLFEVADGGSLFLDEIGDMSSSAQAKVLRALESGEISRVGSEQSIAVDVRVLAATNKDLEAEVQSGNFRDDLYFRLNVVPMVSPALRDRREDIPLLAAAFFREFCREYGGREKPIDPAVFGRLRERPWPGNVRELRNVVERMVILSGPRIELSDVPADSTARGDDNSAGRSFGVPLPDGEPPSLKEFRERAEAQFILETVKRCEWNISRAATVLGVERTNLHKKMRALGIRRDPS